MERIPILKLGDALLVTIQVDMHDQLALTLQEDLTTMISKKNAKGVLIDISALEIVDSFIGRMIAEGYLAQGARVYISARKADACDATAAELSAIGPCVSLLADVIRAGGLPADRPALALHCMMGSASYWGPIADRLGSAVDLRAFDMPGHRRSAPWVPGGGIDFHTGVTRIAAAMIDRPLDLIGHSMGSLIALETAARHPAKVSGLSLIGTAATITAISASRSAPVTGMRESVRSTALRSEAW